MRCKACDCNLTDFEATRKSTTDGGFLDLCNRCLFPISDVVVTKENWLAYDPVADDLDTDLSTEGQDVGVGHGPDADEEPDDNGMF